MSSKENAPIARHAVVIPLYGCLPESFVPHVERFGRSDLTVILVDNGTCTKLEPESLSCCIIIKNNNTGGIAGGFNRGVEAALKLGVEWITLLDQDSQLDANDVHLLRDGWKTASQAEKSQLIVVGPRVHDIRRPSSMKGANVLQVLRSTRLLISSGTTFKAILWPRLGPFLEWLFIDFVDHEWCFRVQKNGFRLYIDESVVLCQAFGERHPNQICHMLGMQLYSSERHFYSIRNLRWLIRKSYVPLDLKLKEVIRMLFKIPLWLVLESGKIRNLHAVFKGLVQPLAKD